MLSPPPRTESTNKRQYGPRTTMHIDKGLKSRVRSSKSRPLGGKEDSTQEEDGAVTPPLNIFGREEGTKA